MMRVRYVMRSAAILNRHRTTFPLWSEGKLQLKQVLHSLKYDLRPNFQLEVNRIYTLHVTMYFYNVHGTIFLIRKLGFCLSVNDYLLYYIFATIDRKIYH